MKKINKQTLKYILAGFICFFSLFAFAAAALAWFTQNRTVYSEQTVSGKNHDVHAGFYLYKFTKDYNGDATDRDENDNKFDLKNFVLNTYDTIFTYQNAYTAAVLRVHLYGGDVPTPTTPQTISVTITRDVSKVDSDPSDPNDITTYKFISSAADFSIGTLADYSSYTQNGDLDDIANISTFMQDADTYFKNGIAGSSITPQHFVVVDNVNGNSKLSEITLNLTYSSVDVVNGVNHLNFLIYINYNQGLLQTFTDSENMQLTNGLGANDILLANDLSSLVVNVG